MIPRPGERSGDADRKIGAVGSRHGRLALRVPFVQAIWGAGGQPCARRRLRGSLSHFVAIFGSRWPPSGHGSHDPDRSPPYRFGVRHGSPSPEDGRCGRALSAKTDLSACCVSRKPARRRPIRARLHERAGERRRFGYRQLGDLLQREGRTMNEKKRFRLCRVEGLSVRRRRGPEHAIGTRAPMAIPQEPGQRWSSDFVSDARLADDASPSLPSQTTSRARRSPSSSTLRAPAVAWSATPHAGREAGRAGSAVASGVEDAAAGPKRWSEGKSYPTSH